MAAILGLFVAQPASADETINQTITHVLYNAEADYAFFIGPARWGAQGCASAYYGTCASDPNYFNAYYMSAENLATETK